MMARAGRNTLKRVVGALTMLAGGGMVLMTLLVLNDIVEKKEDKAAENAVEMRVTKEKKKKEPKKAQRKKAKPRKARAKAPPPPALSQAIGSVGIDLPGFGEFDIGELNRDLLKDYQADVMSEDSVDQPAQPVRTGSLKYPKRAQQKGLEGLVELSCFVNKNGDVEEVRVVSANPVGVFEESAKAFVRSWKFKPGQYKGQSIDMWMTVPIEFKLQ